MLGAILNAVGIVVGGGLGRARPQPLSAARESFFQVSLGVFAVYYGLRLTWVSINGSFLQVSRQLIITIVALMLGNVLGRLLGLQAVSNQVGRHAKQRIENATRALSAGRTGEGFKACSALFCAAPLGLVGALADGVAGYPYPLGVKAVLDGLAAMGLAPLFGWGVILSALPVFVLQGTISLLSSQVLKPFLDAHSLTDSVTAVAGFLVFTVALVLLKIKKVALADYLPSLVVAPLLAALTR